MFNGALIQQAGNENTALVEQRAGDGRNESLVRQNGTRNSADVSQRMDTGTNVSLVAQLGTENRARVEQVGEFISTNKSEIDFDGAGNNVEVLQG